MHLDLFVFLKRFAAHQSSFIHLSEAGINCFSWGHLIAGSRVTHQEGRYLGLECSLSQPHEATFQQEKTRSPDATTHNFVFSLPVVCCKQIFEHLTWKINNTWTWIFKFLQQILYIPYLMFKARYIRKAQFPFIFTPFTICMQLYADAPVQVGE